MARILLVLKLLVITQIARAKRSVIVPEVTFEVYRPYGFTASIPETQGVAVFVFEGNVDKEKKNFTHLQIGTLRGWGYQHVDGRWVFSDPAKLTPGDIINYYVYVNDGDNGLKENLSFTVSDIVCQPSVTKVRERKVCPGETLYEDHFSNDELRKDFWQIEQYIPVAHPEYPFVSYQKSQVSVSNGYLRIKPELQQMMTGYNNDSIYLGSLDLYDGCTANAEACYRQAPVPEVLPPVVSGRITSSNFAFTYGTVHIRAKLPQGNWIYPEILLVPFLEKYGKTRYSSGVIKIASAHGNKQFGVPPDEHGNKVLYGGPIMDFDCRHELLSSKFFEDGRQWGDDFHEYSVTWTPDKITLLVDGEEWAKVDPTQPLHEFLPRRCSLPHDLLAKGTDLAPFDAHFYLTLGVAVGGITDFKDLPGQKPWINTERKAMLHFWEALDSWHKTWSHPELLVDYVKVVALNETSFVY